MWFHPGIKDEILLLQWPSAIVFGRLAAW